MNTERSRAAGYRRLAEERKERERAAEARLVYVASLGHGRKPIRHTSFSQVTDLLVQQGYLVLKGKQKSKGFVVPHPDRDPAIVNRVKE